MKSNQNSNRVQKCSIHFINYKYLAYVLFLQIYIHILFVYKNKYANMAITVMIKIFKMQYIKNKNIET